MSALQLKTFADFVAAVREECGIQSTDTTMVNRIKRDFNTVYTKVCSKKEWWWLLDNASVVLPAYVSAGTATVSSSSSTVTLTVAPQASKKGFYFAIDGYREIYKIESHTAGSLTLLLDSEYTGGAATGVTYRIWTNKIPLSPKCRETTKVWHDHSSLNLEPLGLQEFRRLVSLSPRAEGKPRYYYTSDFVDPSQTSAITSMPALSTRASTGIVKTLVFASGIPSAITTPVTAGDPVTVRISGAGNSSYNGDVLISAITTTAVTNDTLIYTGGGVLTESAVADSGLTIQALDQQQAYDRYREIFVYPAINSSNTTLHVDYVEQVTPLVNDSDEPVVPIDDRDILLYGTLERVWRKLRNPEESTTNGGLYREKLTEMEGELQDTQEKPRIEPSKLYLSGKRNSRRSRSLDSRGPIGDAGGAGAAIVTGVANTVAIFGTDGAIAGSPIISTSELNYLDGATSNIQTQLNAITTLADGAIYLGNSSNVATEVVPTGDVVIDDAGVTSISTGVIVDADVNASAAIAYSKLALTGGIVNADINSSAAIAYSKLALTGNIVNADVKSSAAIAYSKLALTGSIVNADVSTSAAIAYSKLALTGTIDNADVIASEAIAYSKLNLATSIVNADIGASAAIAYSKLALSGSIVNADVNASAAIAYSKLNLATSIVNADIGTSAAIAYSKLALTGSIVNADVNASAAIAYSKLTLTGSIVNADVNASAAIAYSKLNLGTSIVNADISTSAAIAASKLAHGTANQVLITDSGNTTAQWGTVPIAGGGTGQTTKTTAFDALSPMTTKGDIIAYSSTGVKVGVGSDGQVLTADAASTPGVKWATPATAPSQSYEFSNLGLSVTASTGTITVALKQSDGSSDPSTGASAVKIGFRDPTATSGDYNQRSVTSALSLSLAGATTLGAASAATVYVYVYAFDNAGTITLGASLVAQDEGTVQSSSTTANSNQVIYQASALSSKPVRIIGRFKAVNTSSSWASPTEVSLIPYASDKIYLQWTNNGSASLTANTTNIAWTTKVVDSHNAWGVSSTTFTAPRTGFYLVQGSVTISTNTDIALSLYVGGTLKLLVGRKSVTDDKHLFSGSIFLTLGDAVTFRSNTSVILTDSATTHWISISSQG